MKLSRRRSASGWSSNSPRRPRRRRVDWLPAPATDDEVKFSPGMESEHVGSDDAGTLQTQLVAWTPFLVSDDEVKAWPTLEQIDDSAARRADGGLDAGHRGRSRRGPALHRLRPRRAGDAANPGAQLVAGRDHRRPVPGRLPTLPRGIGGAGFSPGAECRLGRGHDPRRRGPGAAGKLLARAGRAGDRANAGRRLGRDAVCRRRGRAPLAHVWREQEEPAVLQVQLVAWTPFVATDDETGAGLTAFALDQQEPWTAQVQLVGWMPVTISDDEIGAQLELFGADQQEPFAPRRSSSPGFPGRRPTTRRRRPWRISRSTSKSRRPSRCRRWPGSR